MKTLSFSILILLIMLLSGCAVPYIISDITDEVRAGKREQQKLEQEVIKTMQKQFGAKTLTSKDQVTQQLNDHFTTPLYDDYKSIFTTKPQPSPYFFQSLDKKGTRVVERIWSPTILVDKQLAVLWASYDQYVGGEFSHCGTAIFSLMKKNDGWMLTNTKKSVQKMGCDYSLTVK